MVVPQELIDALAQKEKAQMRHSWMYSFMPVEDEVYLVGYCKVCNYSVSVLVPHDRNGAPRVSFSNVPKWGCVPQQEL